MLWLTIRYIQRRIILYTYIHKGEGELKIWKNNPQHKTKYKYKMEKNRRIHQQPHLPYKLIPHLFLIPWWTSQSKPNHPSKHFPFFSFLFFHHQPTKPTNRQKKHPSQQIKHESLSIQNYTILRLWKWLKNIL